MILDRSQLLMQLQQQNEARATASEDDEGPLTEADIIEQQRLQFQATQEDAQDNEPMSYERISQSPEYVIFSIPKIYVSVSETNVDRTTPNFRAIKYEDLAKYAKFMEKIDRNTQEEQYKLSDTLINELLAKEKNQKILKKLDLLQMISHTVQDTDLSDPFINSVTKAISLDRIRRFVNSPEHGMLVAAEECDWNGAMFYSQLNDEYKLRARKDMNATNLNFIYYIMLCFEQSVLFHPDRLHNRIIDLVNVCFVYMLLIINSNPMENMSCNDLKNNIIGYLIDILARTRLIQAWKRYDHTRVMLQDMGRLYSPDHLIVAICKLDTAADRAKKIISYLANNAKKESTVAKFIGALSYDKYTNVLNDTIEHIDGNDYYVFSSRFIHRLSMLEGFHALNKAAMNGGEEGANEIGDQLKGVGKGADQTTNIEPMRMILGDY